MSKVLQYFREHASVQRGAPGHELQVGDEVARVVARDPLAVRLQRHLTIRWQRAESERELLARAS
jgi:hypothetical protein